MCFKLAESFTLPFLWFQSYLVSSDSQNADHVQPLIIREHPPNCLVLF